MAKTANLHIRTDPEIKRSAENLFSVFDITVSDAVNMFLRQAILEGVLPFELKQSRYSAETEAAIQKARNIQMGKIKTKIYHSVAEMNADIDGE